MQTKFNDEYMGGFWDGLKFWWFKRKVMSQKKRALWEANIDKFYFETKMRDLIDYSDIEDRKWLQAENAKAEGERDLAKAQEVEEKIGSAKTIKQAYRRNEGFIADVKTYIEMLENFDEQTKA